MIPTTSLFAPVDDDLRLLTDNLKNLVGARHPILAAAAEHLFEAGGKRLRPAIVLLVSRATMLDRDITPRHRRLAEITEMIHTASLVHDDVVDEAELRRGVPTVNSLFDNRVAVLAGDFLFAQSSWYLANLDNLEVVKLLSEVIRDFAEGEIQQGINRFDTSISLEAYLEKSYYKTASLIANSAKAAGVLSEQSAEVNHHLYNYGRNLGLAFQIVDDILDFTSPTEVLGKPSGSDLISGNITAPALFAMEENPYIEVLIEREFSQEGDIEKALDFIHSSQGIPRSKELANQYGQSALKHLDCLASSPSKEVLIELVDYVLSRIY
ncbi:MAG: solanesyl diphosphate synthase [Microcystis panniformis]|uniref:Solanesyl diphosphate synthase n=1 Tax=Microcystis panniformis Mp_MB_F_20051200_S9 TaxID=2486223 RepID=A0A552Q9I9_9CHRO|nr:solanesyl diphosphate synthase [Microcystis aeruginosa F13-15]TRV42461.1 MAG: solanesyl diphosphate synthase [Microcystis panniformis Mp_MB_F_20080800_S26D]TRV42924.1 MAG: solanesyl diphosphate synthase [Microcystis panniformis Mp_GB_SS_20050300_S99]TRV48167.1 MAG: solanesyl diphosphate synthase [Microcystis panniformis Mp_GB_SS_20050300_S99D]TRV57455.1 MAG: solanesyl diphosphate synthase [Microcystis panniformis Mp_MB_F_20080800_S26]TRV60297.1 MAG: solanesyl diphosphate synthase [Microcyst